MKSLLQVRAERQANHEYKHIPWFFKDSLLTKPTMAQYKTRRIHTTLLTKKRTSRSTADSSVPYAHPHHYRDRPTTNPQGRRPVAEGRNPLGRAPEWKHWEGPADSRTHPRRKIDVRRYSLRDAEAAAESTAAVGQTRVQPRGE